MTTATSDPKKYRASRNGESVNLEHDGGDHLVLEGTGVGMHVMSWLEQGWSIGPGAEETTGYVMSQLVKDHILNGNKITAIKQVRAESGMGLGEAKYVVDNWNGV